MTNRPSCPAAALRYEPSPNGSASFSHASTAAPASGLADRRSRTTPLSVAPRSTRRWTFAPAGIPVCVSGAYPFASTRIRKLVPVKPDAANAPSSPVATRTGPAGFDGPCGSASTSTAARETASPPSPTIRPDSSAARTVAIAITPAATVSAARRRGKVIIGADDENTPNRPVAP